MEATPVTNGKILVIGSRGNIGRTLLKELGPRAIGLDSSQLDLTQAHMISDKLEEINPDAIINTAAYTAVDKAETERHVGIIVGIDMIPQQGQMDAALGLRQCRC